MRTFFRAVCLAAMSVPLCASAGPALKGIYKAAGLGLLDVATVNGRLVGKFRTGGSCSYSVDEEVINGTFEGNVFVGTVTLCQAGAKCENITRLYPLMAFVQGEELSGEVPLPDDCQSPGLEGRRLTLQPASAEEKALAQQPARAVSDKIPRNASKKERQVIADREFKNGDLHYKKGRYGLAADAFELSIAAGNDSWVAVFMLGICKVKLRKWKDGKLGVEKGLKLGGSKVPSEIRALAEYALAVVAEANGQRAEAMALLEKAVQLSGEPGGVVHELKTDLDLKTLRSAPEYPTFLEKLELLAKSKKKPKGG
jgi:hypothetical protein